MIDSILIPAKGVVSVIKRGISQGKIDVSMEFTIKPVLVEQTR